MRLPELTIRVRCSKGTYIRSLAREIGEALSSGAYLTSLRRTRSGTHDVEAAWQLDDFLKKLRGRVKQNSFSDVYTLIVLCFLR